MNTNSFLFVFPDDEFCRDLESTKQHISLVAETPIQLNDKHHMVLMPYSTSDEITQKLVLATAISGIRNFFSEFGELLFSLRLEVRDSKIAFCVQRGLETFRRLRERIQKLLPQHIIPSFINDFSISLLAADNLDTLQSLLSIVQTRFTPEMVFNLADWRFGLFTSSNNIGTLDEYNNLLTFGEMTLSKSPSAPKPRTEAATSRQLFHSRSDYALLALEANMLNNRANRSLAHKWKRSSAISDESVCLSDFSGTPVSTPSTAESLNLGAVPPGLWSLGEMFRPARWPSASTPTPGMAKRQLLFVVRHAERVDFRFGRDWALRAFRSDGSYVAFDQGMPESLPPRANLCDYLCDSPITPAGAEAAFSLGRQLCKPYHVEFEACYCSPSLRCIQTAVELLAAVGQSHLPIFVEPGLFEWLRWNGLPAFMTPEELGEYYPQVTDAYVPIQPLNSKNFDLSEDLQQFEQRYASLVRQIMQRHRAPGSSVLIVGHAASLDVASSALLKKRLPPDALTTQTSPVAQTREASALAMDLYKCVRSKFHLTGDPLKRAHQVPYCGTLVLRASAKGARRKWVRVARLDQLVAKPALIRLAR